MIGDGSRVLSQALDEEFGVKLIDIGTVVQPRELRMVPFGSETWCQEIVSLGEVGPGRMDDLFRTEMARFADGHGAHGLGQDRKLRSRDIYDMACRAGFPFQHEDWDNGASSHSEDDAAFSLEVTSTDRAYLQGQWEPKDLIDPHQHFRGCEMACIVNGACMQFLFVTTTEKMEEEGAKSEKKTECFLSSAFRLGMKRGPEGWREVEVGGEGKWKEWRRVWKSGWRSDRIERWVEGRGECE